MIRCLQISYSPCAKNSVSVLQKGNVTPYSQGRGECGAVPGSREFNPQRMPGGQASKYFHSREGGCRQEAFKVTAK